MARQQHLFVFSLALVLSGTLAAEAGEKAQATSPIQIFFDAGIRTADLRSNDVYGLRSNSDRLPYDRDTRRDDADRARDQLACDLSLRIESLMGSEAHASGEYALYVDGIRVANDRFDTRYADDVAETVWVSPTSNDVSACLAVDIQSASLLGRRATELEGVQTRCIRLLSQSSVRSRSPRLQPSETGYERLQPLAQRHQLRFDQPLSIGALTLRWLELSDSRCPTGVDCVWAGNATVVLGVTAGNLELPEVELTLGPRLDGPGRSEVVLGDTSIRLLAVDPVPVYGRATARDARVATLLVESDSRIGLSSDF